MKKSKSLPKKSSTGKKKSKKSPKILEKYVTVSVSISNRDLLYFKEEAARQGITHQVLISNLVHEYVMKLPSQ